MSLIVDKTVLPNPGSVDDKGYLTIVLKIMTNLEFWSQMMDIELFRKELTESFICWGVPGMEKG